MLMTTRVPGQSRARLWHPNWIAQEQSHYNAVHGALPHMPEVGPWFPLMIQRARSIDDLDKAGSCERRKSNNVQHGPGCKSDELGRQRKAARIPCRIGLPLLCIGPLVDRVLGGCHKSMF
ncbi:hypothetical protein RSAG8_12077, partial [Rhizoctonia solani AG-8 WAC10335]